jgi:hypothetical protein
MSTIPASAVVNVTPSVLSAGGRALDIIGLLLTTSARVPIGTVQDFGNQLDVANFFGPASTEAALAEVYFNGFDNSYIKPALVKFTQYNTAAVPAYMRSGAIDALTLTQLKAIPIGSLTLPIDGANITAGSVNLSTATSFSNAAQIIQSSFTQVQATATANTIAGTTLTLGGTITGTWAPGQMVTGTNVTAGSYIVALLSGTPNADGATYQLSAASTVGSGEAMDGSVVPLVTYDAQLGSFVFTSVLSAATESIGYALSTVTPATFTGTGSSTNLTASSVTGYIQVGSTITGTGVPASTTIVSQTSGVPGGAGVYVTSGATTSTGASLTSTPPASLAVNLLLTNATGAVVSPGAAAADPVTFMDALVNVTQDWATFMTCFDPDGGSGNTIKYEFAAWNGGQNNRWAYVCWDTDLSPSTENPAAASLGQLIAAAQISGTCLIGGDGTNPVTASYAAFICGYGASLQFTRLNGRTDLCFRSQSGLVATCSNQSKMDNLIANGYNLYGAYATANDNFIFLYPGSVSGDFEWMDSYINQIWLNNQLQLAGVELLINTPSIPYNQAGYSLIDAAFLDPINEGVNFGAIRVGVTLSQAQIAEVNNAAGVPINNTLSNRGWFLQVLDPGAQVRQARGSPVCTLWYMDGGDVQMLDLSSILVQ